VTTDPLRAISTRRTPQSQPADARQVRNDAGGYTFTVSPVQQLRRFLVLGVQHGTYHVGERELALRNAGVVLDMTSTAATHRELVDTIVDVSERGLAPRSAPALFALAVACSHGDDEGRRYALDVVPRVARTSTHLFNFLTYVRQFRGWGRGLRRAASSWYLAPDVERVAYQAVKYRQRDGWTHRDVLRKAHPRPPSGDDARDFLFGWITGRHGLDLTSPLPEGDPLRLVEGYERARRETRPVAVAARVLEYGLPWEALPTDALAHAVVWEALLERGLPQTALLRQLPRLTRLGLLSPLGAWTPRVTAQLTSAERLAGGRVHPLALFEAQRVYASGRPDRGSSTWTPSRLIVDALDAAFYAAFGAVTPTGGRVLLALDVSGSMSTTRIAGSRLTPREASAALSLVTANVEDRYELLGFTGSGPLHPFYRNYRDTPAVTPLSISPNQRLDDVVRYVNGLAFGRTDCALPMLYAAQHGLEVDTFVLYTDNESWAGSVHPHQALRAYRERTGIAARFVVVAMTATSFTVADPTDPGSLDVVGFDAGTPELISSFARGEL
jgi:60 kDa SS-A/Ro ribonucleoprotein